MGVNLTLMANKGSAEAGRSVYLSVVNDESKKPMELQESFLMQLIRDNDNTEIGKKYGFKDIHSIRSRLSIYMLPSKVHVLDRLPLNANGKIDRQALKQLLV